MDLNAIPPELASRTAQILGTKVLVEVSGKIRRAISGTPKEQALIAAYRHAVESFVASLPEVASAYVDVVGAFFTDDAVASEFASLLAPSSQGDLDLNLLRQRFEELGFDLTTMPGFSFERSIRAFASAFSAAASEDTELRSILSYQGIQRIEAKLTALIAMHEQSAVEVEAFADTLVKQHEAEAATSSATSPQLVQRYRFPSQQLIRYVSLGTDEQIPEAFAQLLQGLAMTPENWIKESTDAVEFVLSVEDFFLIVNMIGSIGRRMTQTGSDQPAVILAAIRGEVIRETKESVRLQRCNSTRPVPEQVHQLQKLGIPYVVIGVNTQFASMFELARTILHLGKEIPNPERSGRELHFESVEDILDVVTLVDRAVRTADGDQEQFVLILTEGIFKRAFDKTIGQNHIIEQVLPSRTLSIEPEDRGSNTPTQEARSALKRSGGTAAFQRPKRKKSRKARRMRHQ